MFTIQLMKEAVAVGSATTVLGLLVSLVMIYLRHSDQLQTIKKNDWLMMGVALFVTGSLFHIIAEMTGVNSAFCTIRRG